MSVVLGVVVLHNRSCVMTSCDLFRNVSDRCSFRHSNRTIAGVNCHLVLFDFTQHGVRSVLNVKKHEDQCERIYCIPTVEDSYVVFYLSARSV